MRRRKRRRSRKWEMRDEEDKETLAEGKERGTIISGGHMQW